MSEIVEMVIKIPKETLDVVSSFGLWRTQRFIQDEVGRALAHGVLLPKGHGRLIDGDKLIRPEIQPFLYHLENGDTAIPEIDILHALTIIEPDKGANE